jgi:hypothetical protein
VPPKVGWALYLFNLPRGINLEDIPIYTIPTFYKEVGNKKPTKVGLD